MEYGQRAFNAYQKSLEGDWDDCTWDELDDDAKEAWGNFIFDLECMLEENAKSEWAKRKQLAARFADRFEELNSAIDSMKRDLREMRKEFAKWGWD